MDIPQIVCGGVFVKRSQQPNLPQVSVSRSVMSYNEVVHWLGLDSRAGAPVLGCGPNDPWILEYETGNSFRVFGYQGAESGNSEVLREGTFSTVYEMPSGQNLLLVVNRGLGRPSQNSSLIPPFMMRQAGVIVNDVAVQHTENDHTAHAIVIPDRGHVLHLELTNTQSSLRIRRPTEDDELDESAAGLHVERATLTDDIGFGIRRVQFTMKERELRLKGEILGTYPLVTIFHMWLVCYPKQFTLILSTLDKELTWGGLFRS